MKKIVLLILALILSLSVLASCTPVQDDNGSDTFKVGVIQYVSHPSLDNCYAGVEAALKAEFGENIEIVRQIGYDASHDNDCGTYAGQFAAQNYDMMIAIATPAAAPAFAAAEAKDIPVVFCAVSDPVSAGLVQSLDKPGYNCSGTSDVLDMEAQIKLITSIQPDVKKIGVLYTSSESNSIAQLALLEAAAKPYNIEIVAQSIQTDADIPAAATALVAKVDCLNKFTDNKVVNNLQVVLDAANGAKIPVYGSEIEQVKAGCLASVSIDYVELGKVTGAMAAKALKGDSLANMKVETISEGIPVVNSDVLASFDLTLPEAYANAEIITSGAN